MNFSAWIGYLYSTLTLVGFCKNFKGALLGFRTRTHDVGIF